MKKILQFICVAVFMAGAIRAMAADKGPKLDQTPSLALHPTNGYAYQLVDLKPEEQSGVLLRFTFTRALHYRREIEGDTAQNKRKVGNMDTKKEEIYMPTEDSNRFIVKITGSASEGQEWNSRGALLSYVRRAATNSVDIAVQDTGLFPEMPVKVGDEWEQREILKSTSKTFTNTFDSTTKWKFVGVADVRAHRCVVLEGSQVEQRTLRGSAASQDVERTARLIIYFDTQLGAMIEHVDIFNADSKKSLPKSKRKSPDTITQGQNILALEE